MRRWVLIALLLSAGCSSAPATAPAKGPPKPRVYVILWFDTEDYLEPAADDAALRTATFLSGEGLRGTFKVVGEKARVLEKRGRTDVIAALKKHEIGFHSNFHSVHPTPAQYLSALGWDEGVAEFERREGPGVEDLRRIFGVNPSCYGQPGSSWGPQAFGAMKKYGMKAYLDSGSHVSLDGKPHYYCGLLTMYRLTHTLRTGLGGDKDLEVAKEKFVKSREQLLKEGGGLVSIFYHPCEFVHKQFWDSIFKDGANPARADWTPPPQKTPEESKVAYETFESWIRFIKSFPDVTFITASQAAELYRDESLFQMLNEMDVREIAGRVGGEVNYQVNGDQAYAASDVFAILNSFVAARAEKPKTPGSMTILFSPQETLLGPEHAAPVLDGPVSTDWSQFGRTAVDVDAYVQQHRRLPSTVWLGSRGIPPDAYLTALARVSLQLLDGKTPGAIEITPAKFTVGARVADDSPKIFGWLFPPGWHAPAMMELARRQAWTIKPAFLHDRR